MVTVIFTLTGSCTGARTRYRRPVTVGRDANMPVIMTMMHWRPGRSAASAYLGRPAAAWARGPGPKTGALRACQCKRPCQSQCNAVESHCRAARQESKFKLFSDSELDRRVRPRRLTRG